jgi:hypothetical protein
MNRPFHHRNEILPQSVYGRGNKLIRIDCAGYLYAFKTSQGEHIIDMWRLVQSEGGPKDKSAVADGFICFRGPNNKLYDLACQALKLTITRCICILERISRSGFNVSG